MESFANESGLLPEQVWDTHDIPERELYLGRPSGSAMPLVWAHAEYVKLRRSLHDGRVFDTPPQPVQRYLVEKTGSPHMFWRFDQKCRSLSAGKVLRLEVLAPAVVHWSSDGWDTAHDTRTRDTGARSLPGRPAHGEVGCRGCCGVHLLLARGRALGRTGLPCDGRGKPCGEYGADGVQVKRRRRVGAGTRTGIGNHFPERRIKCPRKRRIVNTRIAQAPASDIRVTPTEREAPLPA